MRFSTMFAAAALALAVLPAAANATTCNTVAPFQIGYDVRSLNFDVRAIAMFQGQPDCHGGITNSFFANAGGSVLIDPFTKTRPITTTFLLGVASDINEGEEGQDHLVIFGNTNWGSAATSIAFGTLFPEVLEADLIGALLTIGGGSQDQMEIDAAVNTLFNFYDYQFSAPGGDIGFAAGDAFSAIAFSDGQLIGQGQSFVIPLNTAVPEPASWAMLIAGFGLVGAVRRRQIATVSA